MSKKHWLKKYTKLEYLHATLQQRQLYLGYPKEWDDKNDSECIRLYSATSDGFEIRATCLTEAADRFHFWHVFGEREKGVCLWFDKNSLLNDIKNDASLVANEVQYPTCRKLSQIEPHLIPFIKREQYQDEREFRVLRVKAAHNTAADKFSFSARSLRRVYLNPWLSSKTVEQEKSKIAGMLKNGLKHVEVLQNRSLRHDDWIAAVSSAAHAQR